MQKLFFSQQRILIQNFAIKEIICALAYNNTQDINQIDNNLTLPSLNCYNIKNINSNGNLYYGIGGDNCDYRQPIVINYNSSPYYAQRVFILPFQWVFQSSTPCPSVTTSISVNNLTPKSTQFQLTQYFNPIHLCDYYTSSIVYDNVNQLVTKISYYPGQETKYIEQLYILIFKCPLGCSSCDSGLLNCQSCADGYYLNGISCLKCNSNCLTCINSSNYCLSCPTKKYPTQQLIFMNAFGNLIRSDSQNYESPRYKLVNISLNILQTSGVYYPIQSDVHNDFFYWSQ
ncbi:hypothetical protein ABPG74_009480 [Tetrahymena malaccensis]